MKTSGPNQSRDSARKASEGELGRIKFSLLRDKRAGKRGRYASFLGDLTMPSAAGFALRHRNRGSMGRIWRLSSAAAALLLLSTFLLVLQSNVCVAQFSKPRAQDEEAKKNNKFLQREATDDKIKSEIELDEEALHNTQCPQHLELRWQTEVGSSIYATPLISDINGDGKLEIVVPTFVHYLEVLEGSAGEKLTGWPAQHQSTVHASALLYDIDGDGNKEIAISTFEGEVLFFRSGGYLLPEKLVVPRIKVKKDWFVGLDPDPNDRTHPDVHDESLVKNSTRPDVTTKQESETFHEEKLVGDHSGQVQNVANNTNEPENPSNQKNVSNNQDSGGEQSADAIARADDKTQTKVESTVSQDAISTNTVNDLLSNAQAQGQEASQRRRLLEDDVNNGDGISSSEGADNATESKVASEGSADTVPTVDDAQDPLEAQAQASFDVFREEDENGEDGLTEEYNYDYDDYVNDEMWGDEEWDTVPHEKMEDLVEVDSHILATPTIADIDNDGEDEMIVAASYFYDRQFYESADHSKELGENFDISKYVTGAIVVFNLKTKQVKWEHQLDLTTDTTSFRAYIYSPPTVVDLDGDGYQEIIVGNSVGFLYVIDHTGILKKNFPLQMGEIQAQVVAADINDDGKIEMVTTDSKGNVAAWTAEGKEIWEVHLKSLISQGPTVGDVDGDGQTDIVVPTTSGNIYVLKGSNGDRVGPYPFRTHGRVMSPALLVDLSRRDSDKKGLTIAIGSFDGYFYLIDGPTGCADAIDIGETTYSMALADNVDGGDDLDIIVTTMNGNVYCFQTPAPYHPLKTWSSQTQGRNVFASRYQREGIFVVPSSRKFRDEAGDTFHVTFEIVDKYLAHGGNSGPYAVTVSLLTPGNYRGDKRYVRKFTYEQPGTYTVVLPCLSSRTGGNVLLEMWDKNSLYFSDEIALTFHMQYYRLLKWLLTFPLLGMAGMFLALGPKEEGAPLPSTRHQL